LLTGASIQSVLSQGWRHAEGLIRAGAGALVVTDAALDDPAFNQAALDTSVSFLPLAAFCDLGMPATSGYEFATRLRQERLCQSPLVGLTGRGAEDNRERSRAAGFDAQRKGQDTVAAGHAKSGCLMAPGNLLQ